MESVEEFAHKSKTIYQEFLRKVHARIQRRTKKQRIVIDSYGGFLKSSGGNIVFISDGRRALSQPLSKIKSVAIFGEVAISSGLIKRLAARGADLLLLSKRGKPLIAIVPFWSEGAVLKYWRLQLSLDWKTRARLQKYFAHEALWHKKRLLYALARNRSRYQPKIATLLRHHALKIEDCLRRIRELPLRRNLGNVLRGVEGNGSSEYWKAMGLILNPKLYCGKRDRHSTDPFNKALNIGYGILASYIYSRIWSFGLNPYIGIYHSDESFHKPALVFDIMECFRQELVDRPLLRLFVRSRVAEVNEASREAVIESVESAVVNSVEAIDNQIKMICDGIAPRGTSSAIAVARP